jgi:hypothetical protein
MGFFGMRGTNDWAADERPKAWKEQILYYKPNGMAPLTGLLSKMKKAPSTDSEFYWWTKGLPTTRGTITGVYTNAGLTVAYTSGGVQGSVLYIKTSASDNSNFRIGHEVTLRDASDLTVDVIAKVTDRVVNGASSYLRVSLLEDDDNSSNHDLSDADTVLVAGNINAEGAGMPDALAHDPTKWYNFTQIFRTPLEITGTALQTNLRNLPKYYQRTKMETLEQHSIEMEYAFLWGVPSETTGENGKPERTTLGIIPAIRGGYTGQGGETGTVSDYPTDSSYSGQSWLAGGEDWFETQLEICFRYGMTDKLAFCGSGALLAINKLIKNGGDFAFGPTTSVYGIKITEFITAMGSIYLMTHPLLSQEVTTRNIMVIFEPENITYKYLQNRDTHFIGEGLGKTNTGWSRRDGIKEEFLTEAGLEYNLPLSWAYLTGFGSNNTV